VNIAVVGLGVMGQNHARVLRAMGHDVTTVDPAGHADHTSLAGTERDDVVIATPASDIHRTFDAAVNDGRRVLMVEKPMAADMSCAIAIADQHPDMAVGYVERHNPAVRAMADNLYRIGDIVDFRFERLGPAARHDVDPAIDLATHDIDLVNHFGIDATPLSHHNDGAHLNALFDLGTIRASHAHPTKRRTIRLVGTDGELSCDLRRQRVVFVYANGWTDLSPPVEEPLVAMWRAILGDGPHATATDAVRTLATATTLCHTPPRASTAAHSSRPVPAATGARPDATPPATGTPARTERPDGDAPAPPSSATAATCAGPPPGGSSPTTSSPARQADPTPPTTSSHCATGTTSSSRPTPDGAPRTR
jgi:UDP-N-acetylglucosamine 3-dehydrogenase